MATPREIEAMRRAIALARESRIPDGPNPRVGCVLLGRDGSVLGEGAHQGAGTPHAEVEAIAAAGALGPGATAVVTLEPCHHQGRTGPCSEALIAAGVARVVFAQSDPHAIAAGGAARLSAAGVDVEGGVLAEEAAGLNEAWTFAVTHGRPWVTLKVAASLDGRVAAADGTSRWITGDQARAQVHDLRGEVDAIAVGSGTVSIDDPQLTARDGAGELLPHQPMRVVVGMRGIPSQARVADDAAPTLHVRTHDPAAVLAALAEREVRHLLLEGGPTLSAAFLRAGLVDDLVWYVAPLMLGAGRPAVGDLGIPTIADGLRLTEVRVDQVGEDARIRGRIVPAPRIQGG
ncbi:MAG: bifunctional diaminohydroxyphosphoribosylaminopyrimidine deaminase/5-amino-6-(5-phosphoribosylamino)uracil reductase RibD [Candidatus Nanopelagicales bacterium]